MKNNNDMKSRRLFDAIDGIGDDLINEAADYSSVSRKSLFLKIGTAAASFLIVAAVVLSIIIGGKQESVVKEKVPINFSESDNVMYTGARNSLPEGLRNVCVYAEGTDGKIIPTGEKLIVRTDETCDADLVAEYINVSPKTDYSITKTAPGEFALAPSSGSFFPGTVYNISFGDPENPSASYTFQTETEFFVKSVLPADMATDVPVNTGIEITFSEPIDTSELEKYITVDPEVKLDFKLYPNGKVLAAVPEDPLEYGKIYTVTMAKGLVSSSGRELAQDKVFSFRTSYGEEDDKTNTRLYISLSPLNAAQTFSYRYSSSREFIYSPDEEAAVSFELYNYYDLIAGKVSAELYRYPDADKAASAIIAGSSAFPEGDGLSEEGLIKIGEYKAADLDGNSDGLEGSVSFGTGLDKGIYLAKITAKAKNRFSDNLTSAKYVVIQITDLRAFTISSDGLTLLRVDDLKRGAVSGAEVSSVSFDRKTWRDDGEIGTSNDSAIAENGICTIKTDGKNAAVITVKNGDDALIVCSVCNEEEDGKYVMSYLYTDREKYFSSDTVNFSGFAVGINGSIPSALYVKTADTPAEQIEVGKNGYFSGSLSFEDRAEGGFFITVSDAEGNTVASKYISVTEEQKPQITAKIEFDKLFYRYGERVTVTLKATFFDGTPAEGFDFTLSSYPFDGDTYATYTTDKNGEAVYTFDTGYVSDPWSTDPSTIWVYAELSGFESQTLNVSESVYYFHSDFVFKTVWETNRRALTLNKVDTSKIKTEEDLARDVFPENTVGEPAEGSVSYVLKKYEIIKTEKTEYDYYTKRTYKYYDYRTEESTVDSGTLSFENGVIELPMKKVEGFVGGYYYEIFYNDGRNTYEEYISATESSYIRRNGSANEITISLDKEKYGAGD
ncbi:MAG: Ig-like domain-containing protein, partial [Clostridia bacterium]|nr:Ig-like domain-containing protein [Clostridia bacterium]